MFYSSWPKHSVFCCFQNVVKSNLLYLAGLSGGTLLPGRTGQNFSTVTGRAGQKFSSIPGRTGQKYAAIPGRAGQRYSAVLGGAG